MRTQKRQSAARKPARAITHADFVPFDVVDFLRTDTEIAAWLSVNLEEGSPDELLHALFDACRARGLGKVARAAGLTTEQLARALRPKAKLPMQLLLKLVHTLGLQFDVKPRQKTRSRAGDRVGSRSATRPAPAARRR
ncbi:MAG: putative addiction module antidote protein [Proteobacteria bacterium]|nr:putative addiction module antidote protein [Pseudomonadota bacterium]